MSHLTRARILAWISSLLLAATVAASAWVYLVEADSYGPEFASSGFQIKGLPAGVETSYVLEQVEQAAAAESVNIYKPEHTVSEDTLSVNYYLFTGDASSIRGDVESGSFPAFGSVYPQKLLTASSVTEDSQLLGTYIVDGDITNTNSIVSMLEGSSINATVLQESTGWLRYWFTVVNTTWGAAIAILTLCLFLTLLNLSSARLAIVGLRSASGHSKLSILRSEVAELSSPLLTAVLVPGAVLAAYSMIFAQGYRLQSLAGITGSHLTVTLIAACFFAAVVYFTVGLASVGKILKGWRPTPLIAFFSACTLLFTGTATANAVTQFSAATEVLTQTEQANQKLQKHPDLVRPGFSFALISDSAEDLQSRMAQLYREADEQEQVAYISPDLDLYASADSNVPKSAVVNSTYLGLFTDLSGETIDRISKLASEPGGVVILIPRHTTEQEIAAIKTVINEWAEFEASLQPTASSYTELTLTVEEADLDALPTADFSDTTETQLDNQVLVVTNASSGIISDHNYAIAGLYKSKDELNSLVEKHDVSLLVTDTTPVASESTLYLAKQKSKMTIAASGMAASMVALLLGLVMLSSAYLARSAAAIFLKMTTGNSFAAIHWRYILGAVLLVTAPAALVTVFNGLNTAPQIIFLTVLCFAALISSVLTLKAFSRYLNKSVLEMS